MTSPLEPMRSALVSAINDYEQALDAHVTARYEYDGEVARLTLDLAGKLNPDTNKPYTEAQRDAVIVAAAGVRKANAERARNKATIARLCVTLARLTWQSMLSIEGADDDDAN
jgi:hypothetical protein